MFPASTITNHMGGKGMRGAQRDKGNEKEEGGLTDTKLFYDICPYPFSSFNPLPPYIGDLQRATEETHTVVKLENIS